MMKSPRCVGRAVLAGSIALMVAGRAQAFDAVWDGGDGVSALWSSATNWVGDAALPSGNANDIYFCQVGAGNLANALGANYTVQSLVFNTNVTSPVTIYLCTQVSSSSGEARHLGFQSDTGTSFLAVSNGTPGDISFTGHQSAEINLLNNLVVDHDGSGSLTISRIISGLGSMTMSGAGTVILSDANTYTGSTVVRGGGTLVVNGTGSIGTSSANTLSLGASSGYGTGTLQYDSSATSYFTSGTFGGSGGTDGRLNQTAGRIDFSGNVALAVSASGYGTINLSGGTLAVAGTLTAGVRGSKAGFVNLSGTGSLTADALVLGGFSSGADSIGILTQTGGTVTIGQLTLAMDSSDSRSHSGSYNLNGGTLNAAAISGGIATGGGVNTSTFNFNGGTLSPTAATPAFFQGLTHAYLGGNGAHIHVDSGQDITIAQVLENMPAGPAGGMTKTGTGTLTLSGANTYSGMTTVSNGTLALGASQALSTNTTVNLAGGILAMGVHDCTVNALQFDGITQLEGTWGATGSSAAHQSARFSGTGILTVTNAPLNPVYELLKHLGDSNIHYQMPPGEYHIPATGAGFSNPLLTISGSNNTFDFTGVTFLVDSEFYRNFGNEGVSILHVLGDSNLVFGLTIRDVGDAPPLSGSSSVIVDGVGNTLEECSLFSSGSSPYGYGDMFGKGVDHLTAMQKKASLLVRGEDIRIRNCNVISRSFGHGIFLQGAINTLIEGCYVEGAMRDTDDVLSEGPGSLPYSLDYMTIWGFPIPPGYVFSCSEDGIRTYTEGTPANTGITRTTLNVTVRNCTVVNMRGGITITLGNGVKSVSGCTVIGCEDGYNVGSGGVVTSSQGDAPYGQLLSTHYQTDANSTFSLTVLNSGVDCAKPQLAYLGGSGHMITLLNGDLQPPGGALPIRIGGLLQGLRVAEDTTEAFTASNIRLVNWTPQPVALSSLSQRSTISTVGVYTNSGFFNSITSLAGTGLSGSLAGTGALTNLLDGNLASGWAVEGDGQWLQTDLGMVRMLHCVDIAWDHSTGASYTFDLQVSANSSSGPWQTVYSGASTGAVEDFEEYWFPAVSGRYVRIVGHGNTADDWMRMQEINVELNNLAAQVAASSDDGNVPANVVDGSLATRWSAPGDGQWLRFNLLKPCTLNAVSLAWYQGDIRQAAFDIQVADKPYGPWQTVWSGWSSGTSTQPEPCVFPEVTAQWIRIVGHGNTVDEDNSIAEVSFSLSNPVTNGFALWAAQYDLSGTNALPAANPDGDELNNLWEYALGGNPTNDSDAAAIMPAYRIVNDAGADWFEYAYRRRLNATLSYSLETTTNLTQGGWSLPTNAVVTTGMLDASFASVTNWFSMEGIIHQFFRLTIESQ